jgi:hypothetical protein
MNGRGKRQGIAAGAGLGLNPAPWRATVAWWMKQRTQASNRSLAEQPPMGRPETVRVYVARLRRTGLERNPDFRRLIAIVST